MSTTYEVTLHPSQKRVVLREPKLRHMRRIESKDEGLEQILETLRCLLVSVDGQDVDAARLAGDGIEDYLTIAEILQAGSVIEPILGLDQAEEDIAETKKSLRPIVGGI